MTDEQAKLYFTVDGKTYRVKVFQHTVWIERQGPTREDNLAYDREGWNVYNTQAECWDFGTLVMLVQDYEDTFSFPVDNSGGGYYEDEWYSEDDGEDWDAWAEDYFEWYGEPGYRNPHKPDAAYFVYRRAVQS